MIFFQGCLFFIGFFFSEGCLFSEGFFVQSVFSSECFFFSLLHTFVFLLHMFFVSSFFPRFFS